MDKTMHLIERVKKAMTSEKGFVHSLYHDEGWEAEYPVAVVHEKRRIKEEQIKEVLEDASFFDLQEQSPSSYDETLIHFLHHQAPNYIKRVSFLALDTPSAGAYHFAPKRPQDYWKKIQNPGSFQGVVEYSHYTKAHDICQIEDTLRDRIRSSKEIPSLKPLPFIWVVHVPQTVDLTPLLTLYFETRIETLSKEGKTLYMGWSDTLNAINMRYFLCPK